MKRTAVALLASLVFAAGAAMAQDSGAERSITVTGTGSVAAEPDMAQMQLGVVARADTADRALVDMGKALEKVLAELDRQGVEPHRIQTQAVDLIPIRDNSASARAQGAQIAGFEARSRMRVEVTDLERLGDLIDTVVRSGANDLAGLSFGLQDVDTKQNEARKAAMADALATAKLYADAAGLKLGDVLSISEAGGVARPEMMARAVMADASVPIAGGEVSVTARVTLVIALTN